MCWCSGVGLSGTEFAHRQVGLGLNPGPLSLCLYGRYLADIVVHDLKSSTIISFIIYVGRCSTSFSVGVTKENSGFLP